MKVLRVPSSAAVIAPHTPMGGEQGRPPDSINPRALALGIFVCAIWRACGPAGARDYSVPNYWLKKVFTFFKKGLTYALISDIMYVSGGQGNRKSGWSQVDRVRPDKTHETPG